MRCACGGDTAVSNTRPIEIAGAPAIKRTRTCVSCGWRAQTFESTVNPTRALREREARRKAARRRYEAKPADERARIKKREHMRSEARREAAETGEAVAAVYERWGVV